jgi:hypothetical protein
LLWLFMMGIPKLWADTSQYLIDRPADDRPPELSEARHMKDFPHASFPPETIALMTTAMDAALSRLPHPVNSAHIKSIAETILRSAQEGERDPVALERMAFLELMISPRG